METTNSNTTTPEANDAVDRIMAVVRFVHSHPCSVKSDTARNLAAEFAAAACMGFITTYDRCGQYGSTWKITSQGLFAVEEQDSRA